MLRETVTRSAEWRKHWPVVLAAFVGFTLPSVVIQSTGLVMEPLSKEFGWSRTGISAGAALAGALSVPLSPLVGALIDRWGVRRLALPGILATSLAIAALSLANGSFLLWMTLWAIYGLAALSVKTTIWSMAVTGTFTVGRSLALGVALSGTAAAGVIVPPLTQWITDTYGWREAYVALAVSFGAPTFILSALFLKDGQEERRSRKKAAAAQGVDPGLPGLSVKEAMRSLPLIRVALATLITLVLASSLLVHKVPILTEAGITREKAALLASLSGVAAIVGKLITSLLMERFDAGWIGGLTNATTAIAMVLLLEPFRTPAAIVVSMLFVGYAGGTKLQICAYLTGIYGGMRNFGKIFGVMASVIALASSLGPLLGGMVYDLSGGYDTLIWMAIPGSLLSGALLIRLGPYPEWSRVLEAGKGGARAVGATLPT